MAMAYLAAAYTTLCLGLASTEWREIIVEEETHVALVENIVNHLLVHLVAQGHCRQGLCLATGEDRRTVWHRQRAHLTPYRTDICSLAAIETNTLVENTAAHSVLLNIVVVLVHKSVLLLKLLL